MLRLAFVVALLGLAADGQRARKADGSVTVAELQWCEAMQEVWPMLEPGGHNAMSSWVPFAKQRALLWPTIDGGVAVFTSQSTAGYTVYVFSPHSVLDFTVHVPRTPGAKCVYTRNRWPPSYQRQPQHHEQEQHQQEQRR